jgi:RNA polymerase sigma-70 factor, ECF subfamily
VGTGQQPYPRAPSQRLEDDELHGNGEILAGPGQLAAAVGAARRGDARGWDTLFDRFYRDVHAYAMARIGDWSGAEDVAQEVFVAAVRSIRNLRDDHEAVVQAWLLGICRHKVIDYTRRRDRQERAVNLEAQGNADPAHLAETKLRADELREAMTALTEDQRDILVRRFVLDQSLEDVAVGTGRSVGAVKSMQHRALAALERILTASRAA